MKSGEDRVNRPKKHDHGYFRRHRNSTTKGPGTAEGGDASKSLVKREEGDNGEIEPKFTFSGEPLEESDENGGGAGDDEDENDESSEEGEPATIP